MFVLTVCIECITNLLLEVFKFPQNLPLVKMNSGVGQDDVA